MPVGAVFRLCALALLPGAAASGQVSQDTFKFHDSAYRYSVFTPEDLSASEQLPALLLLHGAGGRGIDMLNAWKELAGLERIILVAPDFPLDARFETTIPRLFPALMDAVKRERHFNPRRVYVFGYSAGGYCAYDAATLASTYFAAAGVFAMVISPEYDNIVLQAKRKTPIAIYIGDRDPNFTLSQTRRTRDLLLANQFPVHYVELPRRDHSYGAVSAQVNADAWKFMSKYSLPRK